MSLLNFRKSVKRQEFFVLISALYKKHCSNEKKQSFFLKSLTFFWKLCFFLKKSRFYKYSKYLPFVFSGTKVLYILYSGAEIGLRKTVGNSVIDSG